MHEENSEQATSEDEKNKYSDIYQEFLNLTNLQKRDGQKAMIDMIHQNLLAKHDDTNQPSNIVIEAATGVGKTFAYILGVLPFLKDHKIIISTATIALQEQIVTKDLPFLKKNIKTIDLSWQLLKGRSNYVCLDKLSNGTTQINLFDSDDNAVDYDKFDEHIKVIKKLYTDKEWNGDKSTLKVKTSEHIWKTITSSQFDCKRKECQYYEDCVLYERRRAAANADILIVNHDLLFSSLVIDDGAILPSLENRILILDEAHHISKKVASSISKQASLNKIAKHVDYILRFLRGLEETVYKQLDLNNVIIKLESFNKDLTQNIIDNLSSFVYSNKITDSRIFFKIPQEIITIVNFDHNLKELITTLITTNSKIDKEIKEQKNTRFFEIHAILSIFLQNIDELNDIMQNFKENHDNFAKWLEIVDEDITLNTKPIQVNTFLQSKLWNKSFANILTSATLSINKKIEHFINDIGIQDAAIEQINSPFDYKNSKLIINTNKIAINNDAYDYFISKEVSNIIHNIQNGCFVFFNSKKQMLNVYRIIKDKQQILMQTDFKSIQSLITEHKKRIDAKQKSIIFGLESLAEGIDLKENYLTCVVITRLPFSYSLHPYDQYVQSWHNDKKLNYFNRVSLKEAVIKTTQICGRLIRSHNDQGTILILDNRIHHQSYGKIILDSLPPFAVTLQNF